MTTDQFNQMIKTLDFIGAMEMALVVLVFKMMVTRK